LPIGVVDEAIPSRDSRVRKVQLKIQRNGKTTILTRPVSEIVVLERGAILRIVGTAHSSPDIHLISLITKIAYGYKSHYTEINTTISETGLVRIVVFPFR
jgi:hypothetical protein